MTTKLDDETERRRAAEADAAQWKAAYEEECARAQKEAAQLRADIHMLNARITLIERELIEKLAAKDAEIAALQARLEEARAEIERQTGLRRAAEEARAKVEAELQVPSRWQGSLLGLFLL